MRRDELTILQVSPNDQGGGAERVALDLHSAYLARGLDAWLALGVNHGDANQTLQIDNARHRTPWARSVLAAAGLLDPTANSALPRSVQRAARFLAEPKRYREVLAGHEDFDAPGTAHLLELAPRAPHVLHLHNLHGSYFDLRELPRLSSLVPTIATMHDAWLLTGHCAQPPGCELWLTGCTECPHLDAYVPLRRDASAENFALKRAALTGGKLRLAAPSQWLARLVERSGVAEQVAEVRVIPNGIDLTVFTPGAADAKAAARAELGLGQDSLVIAFAARGGAENPWKGFDVLARALPRIAQAAEGLTVELLAIGGDTAPTITGVRIHPVRFTPDRETLAGCYRASDLYLHPARAETFGLTPLEAMACGTPVIATDVGGIPEVVTHGETGLLVPVDDSIALADAAVALATDDPRRSEFSAAGVRRASGFGIERQVDAYLSWYEEIAVSK